MERDNLRYKLSEALFQLSHFFKVTARRLRGHEVKDEVHAAMRLRERYDLHDFDHVQSVIRSLILSKRHSRAKRPLVRVGGGCTLWEISYRGKLLYPIFNHKKRFVVTFLTPEMAGRERARFERKARQLKDKFNRKQNDEPFPSEW